MFRQLRANPPELRKGVQAQRCVVQGRFPSSLRTPVTSPGVWNPGTRAPRRRYLPSRVNFLRFALFYLVSFGCAGSPVDVQAFVIASRGHSLVAVNALLISVASVVAAPGL